MYQIDLCFKVIHFYFMRLPRAILVVVLFFLEVNMKKNVFTMKDSGDKPLMTLDEAIEHCREKEDCSLCGQEHKQLREWLEDYKRLTEMLES